MRKQVTYGVLGVGVWRGKPEEWGEGPAYLNISSIAWIAIGPQELHTPLQRVEASERLEMFWVVYCFITNNLSYLEKDQRMVTGRGGDGRWPRPFAVSGLLPPLLL